MRKLAIALLLTTPAYAHWENVAELWKGYDITSPQKEWMRTVRNKKNNSCCGTADGFPVPDWKIMDGHYWAVWDGGWHQIPDDAVLDHAPVQFPIMWLTQGNRMEQNPEGGFIDRGYRDVRCFWPGPTS